MQKKLISRRFTAFLAAAAIASMSFSVTSFGEAIRSEYEPNHSYSTQMRGLTAFQIVNDMGPGWNLGNSLESSVSETNWGNPVTSKEMIDDIAEAGFTTLRVPVRWDDHYSNASTYTIDTTFMDRVETVVNYGLDNDMYVIVNVHHNDLQEWVPDTQKISAELAAVWKQVGERFKNYGDKLIFEVNNEPRSYNDWNGTAEYYESVNQCNEAARAAIRATGGNNTSRLVMLPTYCASGDEAKAAAWTKNAEDDMIAASIHAYLPFDFAFDGNGHTDWLTSDLTELQAFFTRVNTYFISKGVPVVIGEFGTCNKNNTAARETCTAIYASLARQFPELDIPCIVWDNNAYNVGAENFGLYNRHSKTFVYEGIVSALVDAYDGNPEYETVSTSEKILFSGSSTSSNWGQAVKMSGGVLQEMSAEQSIYVVYSSVNPPELIMQSMTDSTKNWIKVNPDSCSNGLAVWKYETLVSSYGAAGFPELTNVFIGDTNASLTVTKVYTINPNAHTHNYNGVEKITLAPTATTTGRKTINCSVSGCDKKKIVTIDSTNIEAPTNLSATTKSGQVTLSWSSVSGATQYAVYYSSNHSTYYLLNSKVTGTSYTATGLKNGTNYSFKVKAYGGGTWSGFSNAVYATPTGTISAPTNLSANPQNGQVTVSWGAVSGATQYAVYYSTNHSTYYLLNSKVTGTSYIATGLKNGTNYSFKVKAYGGGTWSGFSNAVYATPTGTMSAPTNLKATAGDGKVTITWAASVGATQYAVYRSTDGSTYTRVSANETGTSYTFTGLKNGTKYYFVVKAYGNGVWTAMSDAVAATPISSLTAPTGLEAIAGNGEVTVTWNAPAGATQYAVYRSTDGSTYIRVSANVTGTSYTFTGLTKGTKYYFVVKAYGNGVWTAMSEAVTATPI